MPLPDLLQWLGNATKTGTLRVERNRATRVVRLRDGRVFGCSSDEPAQRIGQFLLARKKITEDQLRDALAAREETSGFLGQILVEMGALSEDELLQELAAQAEEIIYSLFDWSEGVFRFEETVDERADVFPVNLRIDEVLLRGLKRFDEITLVRSVLYDPGIVLRYTSKPPGPEIFGDDTARSMYSAIDGERTLADILLHLHGTEYQVKKFLFDLHEAGYVEIAGVKQLDPAEVPDAPATGSAPERSTDSGRATTPADDGLDVTDPEFAELELELDTEIVGDVDHDPSGDGRMSTPAAARTEPAPAVGAAVVACEAPDTGLERASRLMAQGELEAALDLLDALYREHPGDHSLGRLIAEAEAVFIDKCYRHDVPTDKIPILTCPVESLASEALTPQEFFLLSRIDGSWDVKSIIQVAPFREVEALRTLKRMCQIGTVELREPA
jgi:hypothetical protein